MLASTCLYSHVLALCLVCKGDCFVLMAVLAQDAIQAALKDYKSKNDGADDGEVEASAKSTSA